MIDIFPPNYWRNREIFSLILFIWLFNIIFLLTLLKGQRYTTYHTIIPMSFEFTFTCPNLLKIARLETDNDMQLENTETVLDLKSFRVNASLKSTPSQNYVLLEYVSLVYSGAYKIIYSITISVYFWWFDLLSFWKLDYGDFYLCVLRLSFRSDLPTLCRWCRHLTFSFSHLTWVHTTTQNLGADIKTRYMVTAYSLNPPSPDTNSLDKG